MTLTPDPSPSPEAAGKPRLTLRQRQEDQAKRMMCASWVDQHGPVRIMAIADGYAMVRRPGCMPFVEPIREFGRSIRIDDSAGRAALAQLGAETGEGER